MAASPAPIRTSASAASFAALLTVGALLAWGIVAEEPQGSISGTASLTVSGLTSSGIRIHLARCVQGEWSTRTALTDRDGRFSIRDVPAGAWTISAESDSHDCASTQVHVAEGRTTSVALSLRRTFPQIGLYAAAKTLLPGEDALVYIRGYVRQKDGEPAPVRLSVSRLRSEEMLASPAGADLLERSLDWELEKLRSKLEGSADPLTERAVPITNADWEGYFQQRVSLGQLGPGAYLVTLSYGKASEVSVLQVTDLALVVKTDGKRLVAFASHLKTGEARSHVEIREPGTGPSVFTDAGGLADISGFRSGTVIALDGEQFALVSPWFPSVEGDTLRVAAYTERPVYRPSQTVHFKGIVRRLSGSAYSVPGPTRIQVRAEDPHGIELLRSTVTTNDYGSFSGSFDLDPETPTGSGAIFIGLPKQDEVISFNIAAYRKPEFEVAAKPRKPAYIAGEVAEFDVTGSYYFGAPLAGCIVKYTAFWSAQWNVLDDDLGRYGYGTPSWAQSFDYGSLQRRGTLRLNEDGRAVVRLPAKLPAGEGSPQIHRLTFYATVEDPTGRQVDAEARATVHSGALRIALEPERYVVAPGEPSRFTVKASHLDGRPAPDTKIAVEFVRWGRAKRAARRVLGSVRAVTGALGEAQVTFAPPDDGELSVVASCKDSQGRSVVDRSDIWVVGREGGDLGADYPQISIHPDKPRYGKGETARLLINSSCVGATALVAIEGRCLERAWTVKLDKPSTLIEVKLDPGISPNVIVSAGCVFRKRYASSEANLTVNDDDREIQVQVETDRDEYRPGSTARLRIKTLDASGSPVQAETSLALVDESIYAIQEDDPTLLQDAFYRETYSRVSTSDSCRDALLDTDGAGGKGVSRVPLRKRFLDTALWLPSVITNERGIAEVEAAIPDNLTRWRATALAHTRQTQLGRGLASLTATLPFHVQLDSPRFLTVGDETVIVGTVRNDTGTAVRSEVRLSASGREVAVEGSGRRTLTIPAHSSATARWRARATAAGTCRLRAAARTDDGAHGDAMAMELDVRPNAREITFTAAGPLNGRAEHVFDVAPGATEYPAKLTVRVTPSVLAAVGPALDYLITYPYGCTEQTVSSFLPDLLVGRLLRTVDEDTARSLRASIRKENIDGIPAMVRSGITRLKAMMGDGWAWWLHDEPDAWLTAYATMALAEALNDGYRLPLEMQTDALAACERLLRKTDPDTAAFAAYALAMHGRDVRSRLSIGRMHAAGLACVVLAEHALGAPSALGRDAFGRLQQLAVRSGAEVYWNVPRAPSYYGFSRSMATALAARAMIAHEPSAKEIPAAFQHLMLARTDDYWTSTRDTAFVLMALCDYLRISPHRARAPEAVSLSLNGRVLHRLRGTNGVADASERVARLRSTNLRSGPNTIDLAADPGTAPFYAVAATSFTTAGLDQPRQGAGGLSIERTYETLQSGAEAAARVGPPGRPVRGPVPPGTVVRVRLTLRATRQTRFLIVTDPLPAGLEPNFRGDVTDEEWREWYTAVDVRDDRVAVFARDLKPGKHVIEYMVRAQRQGSYTALPSRVECMYDPSVRAETRTHRIEVR